MTSSVRRGLRELYTEDASQADKLVWGREVNPITRRGFLKNSGLLAMSAVLGAQIPFARFMPGGLIPVALAENETPFELVGKDGLTILNDRPINAETAAHLLDDEVTPGHRMFVRNNGIPPVREEIDPNNWQLEIAGEACDQPTTFSISELKNKFKSYTYQLQIECGGNGRSEFVPSASGNQWTVGAVACPEFTGVRVKDVLQHCGIKDNAVYIGYYGADTHLSGDPDKEAISRGVPIAKAMQDESLIAWAMNGENIPFLNGYPLRLVCAGWPGSVSGKWLTKVVIRDRVHDGTKMAAPSYRVPKYAVAPGTKVPDEDMQIIESMPVKSLVTFPKSGISHALSEPLKVRGHAWAGDRAVAQVEISNNFGATWQATQLKPPVNRFAWQHWRAEISFPEIGYYEIWARAIDRLGQAQPMVVPAWNPKGYLNNACHRIAVQVV